MKSARGCLLLVGCLATICLPRVSAMIGESRDAPRGERLFSRVWSTRDGLGPLANALSCAACHASPQLGGSGGKNLDTIVLVSDEETDTTGGHLFARLLIEPGRAVQKRPLPKRVFGRRPPPLFGLGLLERVPANQIAELADSDDRNRDGISGRLADNAGRFTWKARFATVDAAVGAALANELGLTNPGGHQGPEPRPKTWEVSRDELKDLSEFVRLLPPLASAFVPATTRAGASIFAQVGCAGCHVAQLRMSDGTRIAPYSDLLLHDMGPALADGFREGSATGAEFRTAPLWGIARTGPPFLHDGRARSIDEAIRLHGGEAAGAAERYTRLSAASRRALRAFIAGL